MKLTIDMIQTSDWSNMHHNCLEINRIISIHGDAIILFYNRHLTVQDKQDINQ